MKTQQLYTRFAKFRGVWHAISSNINEEQASRPSEPQWGEEETAAAPNIVAAMSPTLLAALRDFVVWAESGPPGMKPPPLPASVVDNAKVALALVEEETS